MGGLPWVRLDTTLPDHPKVLELLDGRDGFRGFTVYVCSVAYSGRHGTDGVLRRSALPAVHGRLADARRLVEVDLWHGPGHECPELSLINI